MRNWGPTRAAQHIPDFAKRIVQQYDTKNEVRVNGFIVANCACVQQTLRVPLRRSTGVWPTRTTQATRPAWPFPQEVMQGLATFLPDCQLKQEESRPAIFTVALPWKMSPYDH